MSDELKAPCPFCGKAITEDELFTGDGYPTGCGCLWKTHSGDEYLIWWNERKIEDALRADNARLTAERDALKEYIQAANQTVEQRETKRDALQAEVASLRSAIIRAEQTIHNLGIGWLTGNAQTIALRESMNLQNALKGGRNE
jgi:hypothetical protein